jgi:protease IV
VGLTRRPLSLRDVVDALERGAADDRVLGLVARIATTGLGMGQVEEVRDAVLAFRATGKPAVFYSESFGEFGPGHSGYYLATAFDEIYLQPSGDVGLTGLLSENFFVEGLLERVGIEPRMEQRYEYKNALNLFTEDEMTEPHRESVSAVLSSFLDQIVDGIAAGRGMSAERARATISSGPFYGEEAVAAGLVDRLAYRSEIYDSLQAALDDGAEFLYVDHYLARAGRPNRRGETIALIYGTGPVFLGQTEFTPLFGSTGMGSETVTAAFREAVRDDRVRAIVFRIDSPGGSYVASDAIWREVVRAREAGKPVIATMGDVAGSGGYFVAMAADAIVAQPSTITGSIGVLGGKMVTEDLWNSIGVTWDTVSAGENATMWSGVQDYSPAEWARVQENLDRIYDDFTRKAAEGRGMTQDEIHEVARGRIWSGRDALELGLVDELGGFAAAFRMAREAAGIEPDADVRVRVIPEAPTLLDVIFGRGPSSSRDRAAAELRALDRSSVRALRPVGDVLSRLRTEGAVLTMPRVW